MSLGLNFITDVNGDGFDDAFLVWSDGTNYHLRAYNQYLKPLTRLQFSLFSPVQDSPNWGKIFAGRVPQRLVDLDGDGIREVLALVTSGYGNLGRGICCFNLTSKESSWHDELAPNPMSLEVVDFNRDGHLEVIVGVYSPSNGITLPDGTDDSHCYVYAFSHAGKLLWRREVGTEFVESHPLAVSVPKTKEQRLFVWLQGVPQNRAWAGKAEVGQILALDSKGNTVASYDAGAQLYSCLAGDLNGDHKPEIIATDRLGFIHVLNLDLALLAKTNLVSNQFYSVELRFVGCDQFGFPC